MKYQGIQNQGEAPTERIKFKHGTAKLLLNNKREAAECC